MKDSCLNCRYQRFEGSSERNGKLLEHTGSCHRYPPVLINQDASYDKKYESYSWIHPIVDLMDDVSDWCGEFKPKKEKESGPYDDRSHLSKHLQGDDI